MKLPLSLLALALATAPAAGQALNETFEYSTTGLFPPAGWNETNLNGGAYPGWEDTSVQVVSYNLIGNDAAGHDDYGSLSINDARLESPAVDLSAYGAAELTFDESVGFSFYMAHNGGSDGTSTVVVSTDGGVTWNVEYTDLPAADGFYQVAVGLGAYAGNPSVQVGFHYYGNYAHSWVVDNVVLYEPVPQLAVTQGAPGGLMDFEMINFAPGENIAVVYGPAGSVTGNTPCGSVTLDLQPLNYPNNLILVVADAGGVGTIIGKAVPFNATGFSVQAVGTTSCGVSNAIVL